MPTRISYVVGSTEPVTLAEAKLAARVDSNDLDVELSALITSAREQAEHETGRCYRGQVLRTELPDWPAADEALPVHAASACEVRYWTGSDWSAALAPAAYVFAAGGIGGNGTVLAPALGTSWPALAERAVGPRVRIDLTAGPTGAGGELPVPESVKLYIKACVAGWANNPDAVSARKLEPSPMLAGLLDAERLWS